MTSLMEILMKDSYECIEPNTNGIVDVSHVDIHLDIEPNQLVECMNNGKGIPKELLPINYTFNNSTIEDIIERFNKFFENLESNERLSVSYDLNIFDHCFECSVYLRDSLELIHFNIFFYSDKYEDIRSKYAIEVQFLNKYNNNSLIFLLKRILNDYFLDIEDFNQKLNETDNICDDTCSSDTDSGEKYIDEYAEYTYDIEDSLKRYSFIPMINELMFGNSQRLNLAMQIMIGVESNEDIKIIIQNGCIDELINIFNLNETKNELCLLIITTLSYLSINKECLNKIIENSTFVKKLFSKLNVNNHIFKLMKN
jgi:hypothetical protein